jgi:hypothetical protein
MDELFDAPTIDCAVLDNNRDEAWVAQQLPHLLGLDG